MAASERARLPTRLAQSALSERYSRAKPLPMRPISRALMHRLTSYTTWLKSLGLGASVEHAVITAALP